MADTLLNNTLTGTTPVAPVTTTVPATPQGLRVPEETGNLNTDIKTLSAAQKSPNLLMDFQKVMQTTAQQAYTERQKAEMTQASTQFDPTKVSGGTFAGIISNLEANRGADVSKIYASTVSAYASAQEQITSRLQFLSQLKMAQDQFKAEMNFKKKQLKASTKNDTKTYSLKLKELNQAQDNWEKEFALAKYKASSKNEADDFDIKNGVDTSSTANASYNGISVNNSSSNTNPYFTPLNSSQAKP